ncbi:MgtC/SapB family protein [Candidatus Woesearchaeota archaeon]|nr:MgtC/SapB family protein [Candidatus Woesearchaeota archaeon]
MYEFLAEVFKLLLSWILGTLVGMEREQAHKPVGIRTLSLVALGSTFVTIVALKSFPGDIARVLSGLITGIGFLGAGAVIAKGKDIMGLTTAASIWAMAIVGIGIGMGEFLLSSIFAALIYFILIEGKITKKK